ncbi:OLC1v1003486C1 [Oldenlandia corymbosa var. corymbosa]|uniref:beta-galactosidase n=1 Tax=Oldenlandia corymbosa var. corymbosa TaxID=529605 RepID=A0AAV1DCI7_OLDCO|nr:OLC1v1003486C1 [Oldenlandia corymbosa var. corymbosa]
MYIVLISIKKDVKKNGGVQIENEYNNVQLAYRELGKKYVEWAANMAVKLYDQIPWVMCKQKDAPPTVISTCNGRHCGETFVGPNGPDKPSLWTENWTAQYRTFGDPPAQRAAEDIAFAVALFFARNGTLNNYYMYHGGTNFGRSSSSFVTTRYYDEAPLDEYGLRREPKFGHLRDLHRALRLSKKALLWGTPSTQKIDGDTQIITFEKPGDASVCAAFLINNRTADATTLNFRGTDYYLPEKSISILPDCKTVVFNTMTVVSQHNARNFHEAATAAALDWEFIPENLPKPDQLPLKSKAPMELYTLTKDTSDYAWYSTSIKFNNRDLPMKADILPVLQVLSLGHALSAFINGEYVGFQHGNNIEKSFVFQKPISLKPGVNEILLLGNTVGFPNSGAYMEKRFAGPRAVTLQGLMSGTLDITMNNWAHQVGLDGERLQYFTEEGTGKAAWKKLNAGGNLGGVNAPLTWYKTYFDAPEGNGPIVVQMNKMAKGMIWVNGRSIGRYWVSFLSPLAQPTQLEYHIPRAFVKPTKNLLVVLEETGGDPREIKIMTVNRDIICSYITEYHPPHVKTWERTGNQMRAIQENVTSGAHLTCPDNKIIKSVDFAGFGDPYGVCGSYAVGKCNAPNALQIAKQLCENKKDCTIPMDKAVFFGATDACPDVRKTLAVQVRCGHPGVETGKDDLDITDSIDKA